MAAKKGAELEKGVEAGMNVLELFEIWERVADEEFSDFEKYVPTLQDVRMYQRKRKEYWENTNTRVNEIIKERAINNGRINETAGNN